MRVQMISLFILVFTATAQAKLNVVTTTSDLRYLVEEVGQSEVTVKAFTKGTQDPHYVEAKPSFFAQASSADLLVSIGLDYEVGWLPNILQNARNPKILRGQIGYLEVGPGADPMEIPTGTVSRAQGDVHPQGNPHILLDPLRAGRAALTIAERLGQLDTGNASKYKERAINLEKLLQTKIAAWTERIQKSGVKKIVTHHRTLSYFLSRFNLGNPIILEPLPGIPPTSGHILNVIKTVKEQNIPLILVENYFDIKVGKRVQTEVPGCKVVSIPVAVDGLPEIKSLPDLYEFIVKAIEVK